MPTTWLLLLLSRASSVHRDVGCVDCSVLFGHVSAGLEEDQKLQDKIDIYIRLSIALIFL